MHKHMHTVNEYMRTICEVYAKLAKDERTSTGEGGVRGNKDPFGDQSPVERVELYCQ